MKNLFQSLRSLTQRNADEVSVVDEHKPQYFTVIQLDNTLVRAAIVEVHGDYAEVLGVGRHPQSYSHMSDGFVTDISGVIANCNEALIRAERFSGVVAPSAIIGVTGELVKGGSITVRVQRPQPSKAITPEELETLITTAQRRLLKNAKERFSSETGNQNVDMRLTNSKISVSIDGKVVSNPIGFQGRHFTLTLFSAFAPLSALGALETVTQGLDLTLVTIAVEPYAVAYCLSASTGTNTGTILINVGEGTTGISLVGRDIQTGETHIFAQGGRAFTRRIASGKGISVKDAEQLKLDYSSGEIKGTGRDELQGILVPECQIWIDSVGLVIEELANGELLPPTIYLLGKDSTLPDLSQKLESFPWAERFPSSRPPVIRNLLPEMLSTIHGKGLMEREDVVLMALAQVTIEMTEEDSPMDLAMNSSIKNLENGSGTVARSRMIEGLKDESKLKSNESNISGLELRFAPAEYPQWAIRSVNKPDHTSESDLDKANSNEAEPRILPLQHYPRSVDRSINNLKRVPKSGTKKANSSQTKPRRLNIFLCHSSNDKPAVLDLYSRLKADGFNPWLDVVKLLPGEDWQKEIPKAVRKSDVVIVCLSHTSIQKAGYVQKEIKYALDVAEEQPEGTIFIIPLKLEECRVPERLSRWQWVNFFEGTGYRLLLLALQKRAKDLSRRKPDIPDR